MEHRHGVAETVLWVVTYVTIMVGCGCLFLVCVLLNLWDLLKMDRDSLVILLMVIAALVGVGILIYSIVTTPVIVYSCL